MTDVICDLGQGLVLRRGRAADAEALAAFNADVLRGQDATEPNATMAAWTRDLFTGRHPTFTQDQATGVEHRPSGTIVSSALLVSQIWSFGGLPIRVGQPELVGTHVDYRGRGLVRAQFEVIYRWSAEHGHQLQAIAGIPWFYRQFGYELALARGGGPFLHTSSLMPPPRQDPPAHRLRAMREEDLEFAVDLDSQAAARSRARSGACRPRIPAGPWPCFRGSRSSSSCSGSAPSRTWKPPSPIALCAPMGSARS